MIQSAGVVVIDWAGNVPRALCVRAYSNWDFPKGKLDSGETLVDAAARELREETTLSVGSDVSLVGVKAPSVTYGAGAKQKTATYYLADRISRKDPFLPVSPELGKPENDEYRWVEVNQLDDIMPPRLAPVVSYVVGWTEKHVGEVSDER
tara:strand:+ start:3994 stop:4443 length:450 start_codon:yes stop_codon:yes gene_type:complete